MRSLFGHDQGNLFCVLGTEGDRVLLADGKRRKVAQPKRKNVKHVSPVGESHHETIEKVRAGLPVKDRELRSALAVFRDELEV